MSDLEEVKKLFGKTQTTMEALQAEVEGLKTKSADVVDEERVKRIEADLAEKLTAEQRVVADLKARLDEIETKANRPGVAGAPSAEETKHAKLFFDYLRKGTEPDEMKAMATNTQADGGFLVPTAMREGIQKRLRRSSPMRAVATIEQIEGNSYDVLVDRDDAGFEWAGEKSSRGETGTPTVNRISIPLHELSAMPKVSQRMLDDAGFAIDAWLIAYVGDRFARAEAAAFVAGDGVNKPKGFLAYANAATADETRAAETLQFRVTGGSGNFAAESPADVLVHTFYDLQAAYQANASWMMKNTTAARVATLQDGQGAYLLQSMLNSDGSIVRTIQGRPMYLADDMPAIGSNSLSIAVGDFGAGYTIVGGRAFTVLRDPFSAKPFVLFYCTQRVGGGVSDFDAIKLIKFASS